MNTTLFEETWDRLGYKPRLVIDIFARHPSERNQCYTMGYIAAEYDNGALDKDDYYYLLCVLGQMLDDVDLQETVKRRMRCD